MVITMEQLVMALGLLPTIRKDTADIECPVCGHKTLHFDFRRQVFACPACDQASGGVLDAWALFRNIDAPTKKDARILAKKDLEKFFAGNTVADAPKRKEYKPVKTASLEKRDRVYRVLFDNMTLSKKHEKDLLNRGLSREQIQRGMYKTVKKIFL